MQRAAVPPRVPSATVQSVRTSTSIPQSVAVIESHIEPHLLDKVPTARERAERASSASRSASHSRSRLRGLSREGELVRYNTRELSANASRAKIFSLIVVADRLEQAWINGLISKKDYEVHCYDLISKFTAAKKGFVAAVPDLERFAVEFRLDSEHGYPCGYHRLIVSGLPATKEGPVQSKPAGMKLSSQITAGFITLLDTIEMNHITPEELLPLTQELQINLGKVDGLEKNFQFRNQLEEWSRKLHGMNAVAPLTVADATTLKLQTNLGYSAFQNHLDS